MNTKLRHISYCIIASLLLVACNKETHPITPEQEVAINMSAASVADMTSRAIIDNNEALQKAEIGIGVYAYKQLADNTKHMVFENTQLTYKAANGWSYSPTKYWDKAATEYRFVAYSPHSTSNIRYNTNNHTLTISNIPYWQVIDNDVVDYLVATSSGSADHYLTEQRASTAVNFTFSHILSQLVINIKKDEKLSQTYLLKQVDYLNVPLGNTTATYTLPQEGTATMSEITLLDADATLTQFTDANGQAVEATRNIPLSHLVVPFSLTDKNIKIQITYTVEGTERTKTVDTGIKALTANNIYELTLTFRGAEIIVTELAVKDWVKDWVDEPVDEDPKYNW